jgi:menaquinone-dependent protoporphyrinogen oxidase
MKTLILYASRDGQTLKIAKRIAEKIALTGSCDIQSLDAAQGVHCRDYDQVLIGAAIRYGHFPAELDQFITANLAELAQVISAFYSVNLTARKPEKNTPETNVYTRKFLQNNPWKPDYCAVFAGALRYSRYRWFDKMMIRLIMKMTGGETDPNADIEYTDWQQVDRFAEQFASVSLKS